QVVIARRADVTQRRFKVFGVLQRLVRDQRKGGGCDHSAISIPSEAISHPACRAALRSGESANSAGFELLICRNNLRAMLSGASAAMVPSAPDIAICPIACPVLLPSPAAISSSS